MRWLWLSEAQKNTQNVIADVEYWRTSFGDKLNIPAASNVTVHSGFLGAYQDLRPDLSQRLDEALADPRLKAKPSLYLTGHSFGGSIAVLMAMDLVYSARMSLFGHVHLCTFAAPRALVPEAVDTFLRIFPGDIWTLQNYYDQVPHLPPSWVGFQHLPPIIVLGPAYGAIKAGVHDTYHANSAILCEPLLREGSSPNSKDGSNDNVVELDAGDYSSLDGPASS